MGITLAIFSLSGKIPCNKDWSKICFSGVANPLKQYLITLALTPLISQLFLDLTEKTTSFSSFIEKVRSGNLVFLKSL